jgi:hypothetical protein
MKTKILYLVLFMTIILIPDQSFGQERNKLAQTGMKFLSVSTDARASALNEAVTAVNTTSSSMLYNPANLAWMENTVDFSFGNTSWIADINYIHGTAALNLFDGQYGVIGFSLIAVDYGTFFGTVVASNEQGYNDVGEFSPTAMSVGLTYSKALSQKLSIGGTVKYVTQDLGSSTIDIDETGNYITEDNSINAPAFDFGILYHTGYKSLDFGMSVRNFAKELRYKQASFELPLTFRIGISLNVMDFVTVDREMHSLLFSVDAAHPRDYAEQMFIGGEYEFLKTFALRGGYSFPRDQGGFSAGVGIRQEFAGFSFAVDYSYTDFGDFNDTNNLFGGLEGVQRLTIKIGY